MDKLILMVQFFFYQRLTLTFFCKEVYRISNCYKVDLERDLTKVEGHVIISEPPRTSVAATRSKSKIQVKCVGQEKNLLYTFTS